MLSKQCIQCRKNFSKPSNESKKNWNGRHKFCSRDCVNKSQKGKQLKNVDNKGKTPWNKGKHPNYVQEENHHNWKGENVSYTNLHVWVCRHKGSPNKCEHCGTTEKRMYHWANKSRKYKRKLDDWIRLCVPCHKKSDNIQPCDH